MRTTIDLPDPLFREVKSTAASRGLKLKEFIAESLRAALKQEENSSTATLTEEELHRRRVAQFLEAIKKDHVQTGPVGSFNREELYDRHD
jgi:metal-responsive CopG/Arc/MetJ family transcriptional regulator